MPFVFLGHGGGPRLKQARVPQPAPAAAWHGRGRPLLRPGRGQAGQGEAVIPRPRRGHLHCVHGGDRNRKWKHS